MASSCGNVPVLGCERRSNWMKSNNLLEELIAIGTINTIIEICERSSSARTCQNEYRTTGGTGRCLRPGYYRYCGNANNDGESKSISHQVCREDSAKCDSDPHLPAC